MRQINKKTARRIRALGRLEKQFENCRSVHDGIRIIEEMEVLKNRIESIY